MVGLKEELLKSIWHAFTALDLDRSGKVSKSQLKASGAARGAQRGAGAGARGPAVSSERWGRGPELSPPAAVGGGRWAWGRPEGAALRAGRGDGAALSQGPPGAVTRVFSRGGCSSPGVASRCGSGRLRPARGWHGPFLELEEADFHSAQASALSSPRCLCTNPCCASGPFSSARP